MSDAPVTKADHAIDVALDARRAMTRLRNSDLAGGRVWVAADRAVRAIDDVLSEARNLKDRR